MATDDGAGRRSKEELARAYDEYADSYTERYADPDATAGHQIRLVSRWGKKLPPGSRILELGCADGLVTVALAERGYDVTAVDLSPRMIEVARRRLDDRGVKADLQVCDIEQDDFPGDEKFDCVLGIFGFFQYIQDRSSVLRRLSRSAEKLLVDVNPRDESLRSAMEDVRSSGFRSVAWRGFFVPQTRTVSPLMGASLRALETVPGVNAALLKRSFKAVIKGEM